MNQIDEKLRLLQPVLGDTKIQKLRQMYFFEDDFRQKRELENHIDLLLSRLVKKKVEEEITLPPPKKDLCNGELSLGDTHYLGRGLYPFSLTLKDINRHTGIFGSTGSGKTTLAKNLIRSLYTKGIPFLVFDWEKSYRDLSREFPELIVFTVGSDVSPLFLNFLELPPGIEQEEYMKSIIEIISEDYVGGIGADTMLLNYMDMAFQEKGRPFFEDLKEIVLREISNDMGKRGRLAGRSGLWKETVSRQISFLSKGASGKVINPRKHYPLERLFGKPIVLEFGNIKSVHDRKFFIHVILNWLSIYNQYQGIQSEQLKQALVFEEFHNIAMQGKEDNMVSTLFRESRKYGIGLIAIDQTPSEIPNAIFANINTKISFSLGTNRDAFSMAKAMNLERDHARFLGMLQTGEAIVNVKQRYPDPFLIRPPFTNQDENMPDEELRELMKQFAGEIREEFPDIGESHIPQLSQQSDISPLMPLEKVMLSDIMDRPLEGVDERTKRLGVHPSTIAGLHETLTDRGIIKTVSVDRKKLFELTDQGRIIAERAGIPLAKRETRGGVEHFYWIQRSVQFLKKLEFQPVCEVRGIDIVDTKTGIAIEVETGKSDIAANLLKLKKSGLSHLFMLSTHKHLAIKLNTMAQDFSSIQVLFVKDFLRLTREEIITPSYPTRTTK